MKSIEEQFLEVKQALDYDLQLIPEISQLARVLSERKDELLTVPHKRGVLNFLEKNKDQIYFNI